MSKTTLFPAIATAAALLAAPAFAQSADPAIDTDGDGLYSFTEITAAYPDVTEETFTAIDANADGALDMEEVAAAQELELLPMSES